MRLNTIIIYITFLLIFALSVGKAHAFMKLPEPSAMLVSTIQVEKEDARVAKLQAYLESYNSPMAENAEDFIAYADKYNLDWKLVVSIAGVESWYGQRIPPNSYNGWGWGVYGNNVLYFESWEDGIATISESLRTKYMDKWGATNVYEIGNRYAADPAWAYKVTNFMNKLEAFDPESVDQTPELSITF